MRRVDPLYFRITYRSAEDSIWLTKMLFIGSLADMYEKVGSYSANPLKPYIGIDGKKYEYYFSYYDGYYWRECSDPRKD